MSNPTPTGQDEARRALEAGTVSEAQREENRTFLRALPDYPFLPCKICGFDQSCEHTGWERAKAWHPGLITRGRHHA